LYYPNLLRELGDNSDNAPVNYPLRKLLKRAFVKPLTSKLVNQGSPFSVPNIGEYSSHRSSYITSYLDNVPYTSKEFMINYSYRSQPFSKQSVRKYKKLTAYTTNYNLSLGLNSTDSQSMRIKSNNNIITPLYEYNSQRTN